MSMAARKTAPDPEHPPALVEFARRAAQRGMIVQSALSECRTPGAR